MRLILFLILLLLIGFYAYQALKSSTKNQWFHYAYLLISSLIYFNFFIRFIFLERENVLQGRGAYAFGFLLALLAAQVVMIIFMFGEDIFRVLAGIFKRKNTAENASFLPSRREFIGRLALGIAAIPFASLIYGMYKGKYNFKVLKYELEFDDLPDEFDGYQITQISDVHCGSFDNKEKIAYGVDLIKKQKSDIVVFTGDLVNNKSEELEDWKDLFGSISAPDGVFSILGNHDYGEYYNWKSKEEKEQDFQKLKDFQKEMGWDLLLNESRSIERNGQKLHIVGVENWGNGGFPKYGDEDKAAAGLNAKDFKILLSHDPSHWQEKIQEDKRNYQLTLSGHTHGMQFGIEIPGLVKWSPVKYRYKYWAGIYEKNQRFINVNRGFGYLAYPGRVGMWPEITVIKLKKKQKA